MTTRYVPKGGDTTGFRIATFAHLEQGPAPFTATLRITESFDPSDPGCVMSCVVKTMREARIIVDRQGAIRCGALREPANDEVTP